MYVVRSKISIDLLEWYYTSYTVNKYQMDNSDELLRQFAKYNEPLAPALSYSSST
jgi:elongation factor P--beta-lysine ligase